MQLISQGLAPLFAAVVALAAIPLGAHGGDLGVPPGPATPTMKTLTEVEPRAATSSLPFTISSPASYHLTGNLTGVSGQKGVTITAGATGGRITGRVIERTPSPSQRR